MNLELPDGLAGSSLSILPSGYIQASVGLFKGFELKGRYLPTLSYDEAEVGLYGVGFQYEVTKLLPADKLWPVAVSVVRAIQV